MKRRYRMRRGVATVVVATLVTTLAGCGTIIYPDRRGQTRGRIDPAIAILDGVGVLVFIIPGLIAFAVDFATGAIYLPGHKARKEAGVGGFEVVRLSPSDLSRQKIERIVGQRLGSPVDLEAGGVEVVRVADAGAALPLVEGSKR